MRKIADGFVMLKRYGSLKTACWILYNRGEGAIVEMPPFKKIEKPPFEKAKNFFQKYNFFPKYAFLSHAHWDHTESLPLFRLEFPNTRFIAHSSFLEDSYINFLIKNSNYTGRPFDEIFTDTYWKGYIGGEPLYLLHAPKHSPSDLLIIFRGAMITGDWYIGDITDCNSLVSPEVKIQSIEKVKNFVKKLNYNIHMLFSGHGDCLFYDAHFHKIMDETKKDHGGKVVDLPARFVPVTNIPPIYKTGFP